MAGPRILIHAGYHKTGTTSLQACLHQYRELLDPRVQLIYRSRLGKLNNAGRSYGRNPTPYQLRLFRRHLHKLCTKLQDDRPIVLTRESFVGAMLGADRRDGTMITDYRNTAPKLARALDNGFRNRFGDDADITFLYTVREKNALIKSAWKHQLLMRRMVLDHISFHEVVAPQFDPETEIAAVREAVPRAKVITADLADTGNAPEGPASAVLDWIDMPTALRSRIQWDEIARNTRRWNFSKIFLELNRSTIDDDTLAKTKKWLWELQ